MNNFKHFNSDNQLLEDLSSHICTILQKSVEQNGKATLLVSGGNTPKPLFKKLSKIDIPWEKITIALVDERWILNTNKDSNEFLVKENLLKNFASKANFVGMYNKDKSAEQSQEICSNIYKKLIPFDMVILGMGNDFHTASLFPNNEKLKQAFDLKNKNLCIWIVPNGAPYERMSLTLGAILDAKNIILHIQGEEKLKVYKQALVSKDMYKTPISAVLNNKTTKVEVYHS